KGYFALRPALQAHSSELVEDLRPRGRRAHLQAREEGSDAVADRRHSEGLARYRAGVGRHWQQGPAHSQGSRSCTGDPRGSVPFDQEGAGGAQALGAQPQGQGLQVPPHSHREPRAPPRALLQVDQEAAAQLEV
ncbi:unnamed protein product, partial [Closterium sp. Naga37s-1]